MTKFQYFSEEVKDRPVCMNVALTFEEQPVLHEALMSWSEYMYHMHGSPIVLSEKGFPTTKGEVHIPHLSIVNTWYPQENIQKVQAALREGLASLQSFKLEFFGATNFNGNLFLLAKKSQELISVHQKVIEITQSFSERRFSRDAWEKLSEKEWSDLLENGNPYSGNGYNPHVTISRPNLGNDEVMNMKIPEDVPLSAVIRHISFGTTEATYGVLTNIFEQFPLKA